MYGTTHTFQQFSSQENVRINCGGNGSLLLNDYITDETGTVSIEKPSLLFLRVIITTCSKLLKVVSVSVASFDI